MPNAINLLKKDHREVEGLFAQFQESKDLRVALQICDELERHTKVEEEILYPELKKVDQELYQDAVEEHDKVDGIIEQVRALGENEKEKLSQLMGRMQELVDHHVKDEEEEDFPAMERECGTDTMESLGARIEQRKQQLLQSASAPVGADGSAASKDELLDLTKEELYAKAKDADIEGRSKLDKEGLAEALSSEPQ